MISVQKGKKQEDIKYQNFCQNKVTHHLLEVTLLSKTLIAVDNNDATSKYRW